MKVCPKCGTQYGDDANFCTADAGRLVAMAAPAATPAPAASGLLGGRFQLGQRVGGGGTGAVHRATDTLSTNPGGATVAIKLIAPAVMTPAPQGQRVERELKLLERVQVAEVARVLASGRQGEQVWVATEWVEGGLPLSAQVEAGLIDSERAAEVIAAIGTALLDAAKVGLVHRDLAPKNVLVAGDAIKLINFAVPTPGDKVRGVPGFVSPEAIEGKPIDQRSTTYSLGALAYFLFTGQQPAPGDDASVQAARLSAPLVVPPTQVRVSPGLDAVIARAMDRNPARRYLTLKQFLDDLAKVKLGGLDPATTAPFGRAGKARESVQPHLGGRPGDNAPARIEDVEIPARREPEVVDDSGGRRAPALTIQAPSVPPPSILAPSGTPAHAATPIAVAAMARGPEVDELATQRTPALIADDPHGRQAVPSAVPAAVVDQGSPWAPPAGAHAPQPGDVGPMTAAVQALARPAKTATAVEPPSARAAESPGARATEPTAPRVAPRPRRQSAPPGATGKKKPAGERKANKGKFRETLWFKKGDLDAAAAEEASKSKDATANDKADQLPMEERYVDDGTVTSSDADRYSLKTGQTSSMPIVKVPPLEEDAGPSRVRESEMIGEMKGGRRNVIIAIAVGAAAIVAIVLAFAL